jgi:hypothetical protein
VEAVDVDVAVDALVVVVATVAAVVDVLVADVVAAAAVVDVLVADVVAAAAVVFLVEVARVVVAVPAIHCEYPTHKNKINHQLTRLSAGLNPQSLNLTQVVPETQVVSPV